MLVVGLEDQTGDGETVMDAEEQMGHEMDQEIPLLLPAMHFSSGSTAPYYSFVGGW